MLVLNVFIIVTIVDQFIKFIFEKSQHINIAVFRGWGLEYATNKGFYIWRHAPGFVVNLSMIMFLPLVIMGVTYYTYLSKNYKSNMLDISLGLFLSSVLSNVYIDVLLYGYVIDYILTPFAVINIADISIIVSLILFNIYFFTIRLKRNFMPDSFKKYIKYYK